MLEIPDYSGSIESKLVWSPNRLASTLGLNIWSAACEIYSASVIVALLVSWDGSSTCVRLDNSLDPNFVKNGLYCADDVVAIMVRWVNRSSLHVHGRLSNLAALLACSLLQFRIVSEP